MNFRIFYKIRKASLTQALRAQGACVSRREESGRARMMRFWSIPHEKTMHTIDLFGKYVIPHFRSVSPSQSSVARAAAQEEASHVA